MNPQFQQQSTQRRSETSRSGRGLLRLRNLFFCRARRGSLGFLTFCLMSAWVPMPSSAQTAVLSSAAGGFTISGPNPIVPIPTYHAGFASVDGLGVETPGTGLTALAVSGGEFYYTPINFVVAGANNGHPEVVDAYITTNFANFSSGVLQLMACPNGGACTSYGGYTALPTTQGAEIVILPAQTSNGTYTAYLGLFVGNVNGVAITSPDSATVMFDERDNTHGVLTQEMLQLDTPSESVQTAIRLTLAGSTGCGLSAPSGGQDFHLDLGTVDALAVNGPCANTGGAGKYAPTVPGSSDDTVYYSNYGLKTEFSSQAQNSGTVKLQVTSNFAPSTSLSVVDGGTASTLPAQASFTATPVAPTAASTIVSGAANGTTYTRWIGVQVAHTNGASVAGVGSQQSATVTYNFTVP